MKRMILLAALAAAAGGCETLPQGGFRSTTAAAPAAPVTISAAPAKSSEETLLEAERALAGEVLARGLGPALGDALDPGDGFVVRPGRLMQGLAVAEGLRPPANAGQLFLQPDRVFVARSGDLGVTSGRYVQVLRGQEAAQGRYLITWRKDADGRWRPLSETAVNDPPLAQPASELRGAPGAAPARRTRAPTTTTRRR